MGQGGRARVLTTFTSEAVVNGLERFYDELSEDRRCAA
jgi:hypothetical protein